MHDTDPLAERHGTLIRQVWEQIALARWAAGKHMPPARAEFWLKRLRQLSRKLRHAQRVEQERADFDPAEVKRWFYPALSTLSRAETHFSTRTGAPPLLHRKAAAQNTGQRL